MSAHTTQYTEFFQRGQEAVRQAVDTWTRTVAAGGQLFPLPPRVDADAAIDRYFDLGATVLGAQRDLAKQLVGYATAAGAAAREQAEPVGHAAQATEA